MWRKVGCIALVIIVLAVVVAVVLRSRGEDGNFKFSFGAKPKKDESKEPNFEPVKLGDLKIVVDATGNTEPISDIEVKSEATGRIIEFLVEEGDIVKIGDTICKLDQTTQELVVKQQRIQVERAKLAFEQARSAETVTSRSQLERAVDSARTSLAAAKEELEKARSAHERIAEMHAKGYANDQELDNSQRNVTNAEAQVAQAETSLKDANTQLEQFSSSSSKASIEQARLSYEASKVQLQDAERQLGKSVITSPIDGIVLEKPLDVGDSVTSINSSFSTGTTVVKVANLSKIKVRTSVDEIDIGKIKLGQAATVVVDTFPDREFEGKVTNVFPQGVQSSQGLINFIAIVEIDNQDGALLGNMTADVRIQAATIEDKLLIPLSATRAGTKKDSTVVFVLKADEDPEDPKAKTEEREVELGDTDFTSIVVTKGLKEGELVKVRGFESRIQFD